MTPLLLEERFVWLQLRRSERQGWWVRAGWREGSHDRVEEGSYPFAAESKRRLCITWAEGCREVAGGEDSKGGEQGSEEVWESERGWEQRQTEEEGLPWGKQAWVQEQGEVGGR